MTTKLYGATGTTGSADGAVDSIIQSVLADGDLVFCCDSNEDFIVFRYESSSTTSESSPWTTNKVIEPAIDGALTDGRWVLSDFVCDELTTYGNLTVNGNTDITGTLTFDAAGPAVTVIKDEDTMTSDSATALCTQQSIKAYVDNVASGLPISTLTGYVQRPVFTPAPWVLTTGTITISPFKYHHAGTTEQIVTNDTTITFFNGTAPSASNADNSAVGASQWHYLYIDDSAVVTAGSSTISASELLGSSVAPTWSDAKHGWYGPGTGNTQTTDRCIYAYYLNAGSTLDRTEHDGGNFVMYDPSYSFASTYSPGWGVTPGTSFTSYTAIAPAFATRVKMGVHCLYTGTDYLYHKATGGHTSEGHWIAYLTSGATQQSTECDFYTNTSQSFDIKFTNSATSQAWLITRGFYFPRGM